jgi:hypothetical protein
MDIIQHMGCKFEDGVLQWDNWIHFTRIQQSSRQASRISPPEQRRAGAPTESKGRRQRRGLHTRVNIEHTVKAASSRVIWAGHLRLFHWTIRALRLNQARASRRRHCVRRRRDGWGARAIGGQRCNVWLLGGKVNTSAAPQFTRGWGLTVFR